MLHNLKRNFVRGIKRVYKTFRFEHFYVLPILIDNFLFRRKAYKAYNNILQKEKRVDSPKINAVLYMCPKDFPFEAGLTDRFRGIISIYNECKKRNLVFRIYYTSPNLTDFLSPNEYDWRISDIDVSYEKKNVGVFYLITYHHDIHDKLQLATQNFFLGWWLSISKKKQLHFYSNTITGDSNYGSLFKELFKPSPLLQENLNRYLEEIGGKYSYISMSFRLINLFGDFEEGVSLDDKKKIEYLSRCMRTIQTQHDRYPNKKILIATDSSTLLKESSKLSYVFVIPGVIIHTGYAKDATVNNSLKTFIDMYMISYAQTVYLVRDKLMYHSGFPYRASLINGVQYKEIDLL